jgi:hypothetical protein
MTSQELEYAERRIQQKWYDLVMAEQQGATVQVLERLYTAYTLAVEEYNRCVGEHQHNSPRQPTPVPLKQKKAS